MRSAHLIITFSRLPPSAPDRVNISSMLPVASSNSNVDRTPAHIPFRLHRMSRRTPPKPLRGRCCVPPAAGKKNEPLVGRGITLDTPQLASHDSHHRTTTGALPAPGKKTRSPSVSVKRAVPVQQVMSDLATLSWSNL
jgi:hypothetical protein